MIELIDEIIVRGDIIEIRNELKQVAEKLAFKINKEQANKVMIQEPFNFFSFKWPVKFEITLTPFGNSFNLKIKGIINSYGPIQRSHLKNQMEKLKTDILKIENKGRKEGKNYQNNSLSDEILKLSELYNNGIISLEEFQKAKNKLLFLIELKLVKLRTKASTW